MTNGNCHLWQMNSRVDAIVLNNYNAKLYIQAVNTDYNLTTPSSVATAWQNKHLIYKDQKKKIIMKRTQSDDARTLDM